MRLTQVWQGRLIRYISFGAQSADCMGVQEQREAIHLISCNLPHFCARSFARRSPLSLARFSKGPGNFTRRTSQKDKESLTVPQPPGFVVPLNRLQNSFGQNSERILVTKPPLVLAGPTTGKCQGGREQRSPAGSEYLDSIKKIELQQLRGGSSNTPWCKNLLDRAS